MKKKTFKRICFLLIALLAVAVFVAPEFAGQAEANIYEDMPIASPGATGFWGWLFSIFEDFFWGLVATVVLIMNSIFLGALAVAEMLFNVVASPNFISQSFTGPDNPFVYPNWVFVRDLANIGIVLGVVFCGLKIAFGLDSRATKTSLITLIALAFLINFTPVLLGLLIDAAQIIMNHFMGEGLTHTAGLGSGLIGSFRNVRDMSGDSQMISLIQMFTLGTVCLFLAFIYFILAVVFLVRYIVLWILVILSPLAFLAYAFKGGQKFWKMWWSNFISWTFVGVPIAFFVALAGWMYGYGTPLWTTSAGTIAENISLADQAGRGVISPAAFAPLFPGILIAIGFVISLNIAPAFTKTVMGYTKKGFHGATAWGWGQAKYRARQRWDRSREKYHAQSVKSEAQRLGISTAGWDDRKAGYAVRAKVAKEVTEHKDAEGAQKAHASRYLSVHKDIDQRKLDHSRFGKKIKEASNEELDALIYQPASKFAPQTRGAVAKKRAMAMQEHMRRDKSGAMKKFKNLFSLDEQESFETITAFGGLGPAFEDTFKKFIISQLPKHGTAIKKNAAALGIDEGFIDKTIKKISKEDADPVAHAIQKASEENKQLIMENLVEADTKAILETIRRLKLNEKRPFAMNLMATAQNTGKAETKQFERTAWALKNQWYIKEYELEEKARREFEDKKTTLIGKAQKIEQQKGDERKKTIAGLVPEIESLGEKERQEILDRIGHRAPRAEPEIRKEFEQRTEKERWQSLKRDLIRQAKQIRDFESRPEKKKESQDLAKVFREEIKNISPAQRKELLKENIMERVYEFQKKIRQTEDTKKRKELGNRLIKETMVDTLGEMAELESKDQAEISDAVNKIIREDVYKA